MNAAEVEGKRRIVCGSLHPRFEEHVGGTAHVALPESSMASQEPLPAKFADTATPAMHIEGKDAKCCLLKKNWLKNQTDNPIKTRHMV